MSCVTSVNVLLLLTIQCFCINLPPNVPICYIDDPDLDDCLLNAAQELKPQMLKGLKELGLPSLEPLIIPSFNVDINKDIIQVKATLSNFTVKGFEGYNFRQIGYDPKSKSFYGSLSIPLLEIDTDTTMQTRILFIPMEGTGHGYASYGPFEGSFKVDGEIVTENGIQFYNPTRADINFVVSDGYFHFSGLFNNNENLNYYTNKILNKNSETVAYATTPVLRKIGEEGLLWLMRSLCSKVPYQELFPYTNATLNKV